MTSQKPRILFVSDDCRINTGFGRVVRETIRYLLKTNKYEIAQHAWFSHNDPSNEVPIKIFTTEIGKQKGLRADDVYGMRSFDPVVHEFKPDVVFALGNHHMLPSTVVSRLRHTYYLIHYTPIDNFQLSPNWNEVFSKADELYLFCDWAKKVFEKRIPNCPVTGTVPHGVDSSLYFPIPAESKQKVRNALGLGNDSFVLGFVGRAIERKKVCQIIRVAGHLINGTYHILDDGTVIPYAINRFGEFAPVNGLPDNREKNKVDLNLLLHCPSGDKMGPDLTPTIQFYDIGNRIFADPNYKVAHGVSDEKLNLLFNAMDAFISFAPGGWELTNLEAMSCGLPLIQGNWTAPPDFCSDCSILIEPESWLPDMKGGILRPLPSIGQAISGVLQLKNNELLRKRLSLKAREIALTYSWDNASKQWESIIDAALTKNRSKLIKI